MVPGFFVPSSEYARRWICVTTVRLGLSVMATVVGSVRVALGTEECPFGVQAV